MGPAPVAQLTVRGNLHISQNFLDNFARAGCKKNYPLFLKGNCFLCAVSVSHLEDTKMNYWQHFRFAAGHAGRCFVAAVQLLTHAFLPDVYERAGRDLLCRLQKDYECQ